MHTKLPHTLLSLLLLATPLTIGATGGPVVITVETPVIAGLGTQLRVQGLAAGESAHLSIQTPDGDEILLPVTADADGEAREELRGSEMERAGTYGIQAETGGRALTAQQTFDVLPDSLDARRSSVEALTTTIEPDGKDSAEIRVRLRDRYDNPLPGRPVTLVSSRTVDDVSGRAQQTDHAGELRFLVSTSVPGTMSLRALDLLSGNVLAQAATVTAGGVPAIGGDRYAASLAYARNDAVLPVQTADRFAPRYYYAQTTSPFDIIDRFVIDAPASLPAGEEAPRIMIRAADRDGKTVEDYVGTILFSSTDPNAVLPNFGRYTFKDRDLGQKEFPLVLKFERGGPQKLKVEDLNDPTIEGEVTISVEGTLHPASPIVVTSHKSGDTVQSSKIIIEGKGPRFANLIVMGGLADVPGATDKDGNFSIPIDLTPGKREFTLRVRDDAGRNDSGPIDLIFDDEGPIVGTITFSPERPNTGDKVLVVVQSEPSLKSVTMKLSTDAIDSVKLTEIATSSGSYQAFFIAPDEGALQPVITAEDRAGNTTDLRTVFTVGSTTLPTVVNLRGQAKMGSAALEWDPVSGVIDGYRIYVGEKPDNFLYTLDTANTITKATVAGLSPGRTYYFAVTAVKGKIESGEKSDALKLETPGLVLTVRPGDGKLLLEWTPPKVSLRTYLLEYGVREGAYTESRSLPAKKSDDGSPQAATVQDLLNGVTYFFRLTPVTITGETLSDMAATGQGTPAGGAFTPSPNDPIPFDPQRTALQHTPANPSVGLPAWLWTGMAALALGLCVRQWHRRRMLRHTAAFLAAVESQYRR